MRVAAALLARLLLVAGLVFAAGGACAHSTKISYAADAFFSRQSAVLDEEGQRQLRRLVANAERSHLEVYVVMGFADAQEAGVQALSTRRAYAVKSFLVQLGIAPFAVYAEGRGTDGPVAPSPSSRNRRVEIEFVGTASADLRTSGFQGMARWAAGPGRYDSTFIDPWTGLTPLAFLPQVEPELRPGFLARMQLLAIRDHDDAGLAQLLALPGGRATDEADLPPALYAMVYGDAFAREALGDARGIPAADARRVRFARQVWCDPERREPLHPVASQLLPEPQVLALQGGDEQAQWLLCAAQRPPDLAWLLRAGLELESRWGYEGATPLHVAVRMNSPAAVEGLLRAGADPNARNLVGETPLHMVRSARNPSSPVGASVQQKRRLWDALVEAGADPQAVDAKGASPPRP